MVTYRYYKTFIFCGILILLAGGCRFPTIVSPSGDVTIDAGESVFFSAASYPEAIYKWTFDGGADDTYAQRPTVKFDRPGVYDVMLTVVFDDLDSGPAFVKVTVNDPSTTVYALTESNYNVTRDITDNKRLVWVVEKGGSIIMRRNAQGESSYTYPHNTTGNYRIWLARYYDGAWSEASNIISYSVP